MKSIIIILLSTLLLLLFFFISSSSSSTFIALAQQEEPTTISRDIFCGMNDETLDDTNIILRVVANATIGGTEENPCPLLHISNKKIRKIEFGSFHVTTVVIRDSHFYDQIAIDSRVVLIESNNGNNSNSPPSSSSSIRIDNVIFDYYKNGQTVTSPFSLFHISQIDEGASARMVNSVTIANSKFNIDVDFDPVGRTSATTPRILTVNEINIRSKLEIANNSVHTTFGGILLDELRCAGKAIISNNKIDRFAKYSSAVDEFGTFTYQTYSDTMLRVLITSLPTQDNPSSSSSSHVDLYILNNNITDIRRYHSPLYMYPLVVLSLNISSGGKELLIENNRFSVDGNQLSLLPRSEETQISEQDDINDIYGILVFNVDEGKFQFVDVDRFIIRKNYFFARLFKNVRGISTVQRMITMCSAGEDNFFEISQNTFNLSTKTQAMANANVASLTPGERLVLLKMVDSIRAMSISSGNCHKINISSNVIERIEMFKPILFSPFSGDMFDKAGSPIATMYIIDVGNHGGMKEFFVNDNIFGFVINVDDSLLAAVTGLIIREDENRPTGQTFTTLSKLEMKGNNISCISPSSITTFGFLTFVDDLTHLDTLILENNIIDVPLLTKIVPCAFCVDDNVAALVNLLSIFDPTEALQMREAIAASKTPGIYGFFCPSTGRLSPLASSTQFLYSVSSNVFTAPMPSSSRESPQAIVALFYYPNPFSASSSTGTATRKKSLIFENNTFNVITVHEEVNYFLSTSLFTLFAAVEFTTLRVNNNKHIFANTDHGTASSFQLWQMNAVDSTSVRSFEFKRNQVIRRRRIASNQQQQQQSSSSLSYYRLVGFENVSASVTSVWQLVSPLSAAPPTSRMIFLNGLTSTPSPSTSSSSSHQLSVSNNFIDMNNGTGESDNLMIHFNDSDSNFFNDIQIDSNNIHFSHDRAQACALITGLKTGQLLTIENNQMDFAKCQKTSSILNATTIGGTVSLSNNKLHCGTQCLFASIDQIAPSSTLTMKSNRLTNDKETECDDEQRYLKLQQSSSTSSSFNLDVSSDVFETNCNEITYTRNDETKILNVSALKSIATVNDANCQVLTKCQDERDEPPLLSSAAAIVVSGEVSAALTTNDVVQSFSMGALAIGAASTPTLGFSVAKQQAMMNYAQNALKGDCRGLLPATKTSGEEDSENENPLGAADSPTRMQIGDSEAGPYVGAVMGNFILFCGLIVLNQLVGHLVTKIIIAKYFSVPSNMKLAFMFSKTKKKEYEQQQDRWKDPKYVFINSFVSLSLFYLVALLLSPTLTSAVVVVAGVSNEIVSVGIKILCLIIAFIIAGVGVYFIIWSTLIRKPRREEYRMTNQEEVKEQNKKKEIGVLDMLKKYCKADGEWKIPINKRTQKENDEFQIAEPCFTSYRKNQWFAVVEVITSILLCLPPLFAQLGSSGKSSCVIHGSLLFVILLVYTILLIWKNPKKIPAMRIVFPMMAIQQTVTSGMTLIVVVTRDDDNENDQSMKAKEESWLWKTIFVPMGFSVFLGILAMLVSISPMLTFFYKLRQRLAKAQQQNGRRSGEKHGSKREMNNNDDDDDLEMNLVERKNHGNNHNDGRRRESRDDLHRHSRNSSRNDHRRHHDQRNHQSGSRKEHTTSSSLSSPHRHHRRNNDNDDDDEHHHRRRDHHSSLSNSNHHRHHSSTSSRNHSDRDRQQHNRRPSSSRNEEDRRNHRETRYLHHHDRLSPDEGHRQKTEDRRREDDSNRREQHSNRHPDYHGKSRTSDVRRTSSSDGGRQNNNSQDRRYRDKMKRDPML